MKYCMECSTTILGGWKGWPLKDPIPLLPVLSEEGCLACGKDGEALPNADIHWLNYHSPYSTGLPDYWLLTTGEKTVWGLPYYAETSCPRCGGRAALSEFGDSRRDQFKYMVNCPSCGLLKQKPRFRD